MDKEYLDLIVKACYGKDFKNDFLQYIDDISSFYKLLNKMSNNSWAYEIVESNYNDCNGMNFTRIIMYVPGRVMTGYGYDRCPNTSVTNAIKNATLSLFPYENDKEEENEPSNVDNDKEEEFKVHEDNIVVLETVKDESKEEIEEITPLENAMTFEEIDALGLDENLEAPAEEKPSDDDEIASPGSTITKGQVRFMNEFKAANNIDTDEKFDYYVKTWATNVAVDEILTKKELIKAGYDMLDNFIKWIKVMQPTLDKGIVSPI